MGNFSKSPLEQLTEAQSKGYVGVHIEQGVPVLDRDLNLLGDLLAATFRQALKTYIGDGIIDGSDAFRIVETNAGNDFRISPGTILIGGIQVTLRDTLVYSKQIDPLTSKPVPALTTPEEKDRVDWVYLDAWLDEVSGTSDPSLRNADDVGMQTSVRQRPVFVVRIIENPHGDASAYAPPPGHFLCVLALLKRLAAKPMITKPMITDARPRLRSVHTLVQRLASMEKLLEFKFAEPTEQFEPQAGAPGHSVTLRGRGFNMGEIEVWFGDVQATLSAPPTATKIVVSVPSGLQIGSTRIKIKRDDDTILSNDMFVRPPPPSFPVPNEGLTELPFWPKTGARKSSVKLNGSNFNVGGLQVEFGKYSVPIQSYDAKSITVAIPTHIPDGLYSVSVSTAGGTVNSKDNKFEVKGGPFFEGVIFG